MADNQIETENKNQELKHLGFVRIVAIQALVCVSNIYEYAKQNCGPLRSTVGTVEGTVTTVLYPVYEKLKDFPDDLLVFIDHKIDEAINKFDEHAPPFAKQAVYQAQGLIQKLTLKTVKVVNEAQTGGPRAAINYAAKEYKEFLLTQSVKLWSGLRPVCTLPCSGGKGSSNSCSLVGEVQQCHQGLDSEGLCCLWIFAFSSR
ncbi:Rubber elongation factor protein (REF) [Quillaja saponaria]|uniref:Rubber elongation factor protein (REF) n=1 Tax=Quillaja saponaria TaxID=32244 RepID=A0AAD7LG43_QUISA|nr:Rubber elongation factor protein (REF) [Quillaja saponaria]